MCAGDDGDGVAVGVVVVVCVVGVVAATVEWAAGDEKRAV